MLICVSCVKNEERYLEGFFNHIRNFVDGFVFLDDGSTDRTVDILTAEPKMMEIIHNEKRESEHYHEGQNRKKVVTKAYELGADWVLCADPDERFERRFLRNIRSIIKENEQSGTRITGLRFRELWDSAYEYRVDGIWNTKQKYILFQTKKNMDIDTNQYHTTWYPRENAKPEWMHMTDYNLYHLRMILSSERISRRDKYNRLDGEKKFQAIGYDYLTDENCLELALIHKKNRYDYKTLPDDHKVFSVSEKNRRHRGLIDRICRRS